MTTFLLILMALLLIAALERANRRQSPKPRGLNGSLDRDDRDWARTKLDLTALGDARRDIKRPSPHWSSRGLSTRTPPVHPNQPAHRIPGRLTQG